MIRFLFKGLLRDQSRSLFPLLIVLAGVTLTVVLFSWIKGVESDMIQANANFNTGHVKVMTRAYADQVDQLPNDLTFTEARSLLDDLRKEHPDMLWAPRIKFGGLLDIPDEGGETRAQGPVVGLGVDLFSPQSPERRLLNLDHAIVGGRLPENPGEAVISDAFADRLNIHIGETATLISSTMYGSMATYNFTIVGTVRFGVMLMDRGSMIADISDLESALDMEGTASEILGFFRNFFYDSGRAEMIRDRFNSQQYHKEDEFSPVMMTLRDQNGLGGLLDLVNLFSTIVISVFIVAMSIVLWNAGLIGSLRRYGEIGLRLAIGEPKGHLYGSMIAESLMIGCFGTLLGTAIGLAIAYFLQVKGIDVSSMMRNASMMISNVLRARVTPASFVVGFIPGLLATFFGTSISGIGIYKRQTSQLMKELEA